MILVLQPTIRCSSPSRGTAHAGDCFDVAAALAMQPQPADDLTDAFGNT
jgi:hypothetical protein